jgi:SAM-dependent methyltransferase
MIELSKKEDWEVIHESQKMTSVSVVGGKDLASEHLPLKNKLLRSVKRRLGPDVLNRMSSYQDYLLWEVIFKRYLSDIQPGANVLEIGSAPGEFLVKFKQQYGGVPYGVDYSNTGVQLNRQVFIAHQIDPENVIQADFFSDELHERYKQAFDVVISIGFIEHFDDVDAVLEKHLSLLASGGHLIISIPNFRGVNKQLLRLFSRELISTHNLDIMRKQRFARLFQKPGLSPLFCAYYGTFNFYLFLTGKYSRLRFILTLFSKLQPVLNLLFRVVLKDRGLESRFFSPALLFIGKKTEACAAMDSDEPVK